MTCELVLKKLGLELVSLTLLKYQAMLKHAYNSTNLLPISLFVSQFDKPERKLSRDMLFTVPDLKSKGMFHRFDRSLDHLMFTFSTTNPSMCSIKNPAELCLTSPWHPGR